MCPIDLPASDHQQYEWKKTLSEFKHSQTVITNEETLQRRAWVERAIAEVRGRMSAAPVAPERAERSQRPKLYVVGSRQSR